MKEHLPELLRGSRDPVHARNLLREFLQASLLASLQRSGAMIPLAFQGGTALRFLYSIRRFSEDLDFALERADRGYDLRAYLDSARADLTHEGYELEIAVNDRRPVQSAFVRFPGLLAELDLDRSPRRQETFAIKVEVDTNPPAGAVLATTVIRRHRMLHLQHHDKASLLAGKLHAILRRPFGKGRDIYDLLWYLSDPSWPAPNLILLNSALSQTGWTSAPLRGETWRKALTKRLRSLDWRRVVADVRAFLEVPGEADLLTEENLLRALRPPTAARRSSG